MRERISEAVKAAMRSGDKVRLGTLRLMMARIKELEIAVRPPGQEKVTEAEIIDALGKMVKQRRESIEAFAKGNRQDLVDREAAEIKVIEEFLPQGLSEAEAAAAIAAAIKAVGAAGPKDMGKVMGALKAQYAGRMDFAKASGLVKAALQGGGRG